MPLVVFLLGPRLHGPASYHGAETRLAIALTLVLIGLFGLYLRRK